MQDAPFEHVHVISFKGFGRRYIQISANIFRSACVKRVLIALEAVCVGAFRGILRFFRAVFRSVSRRYFRVFCWFPCVSSGEKWDFLAKFGWILAKICSTADVFMVSLDIFAVPVCCAAVQNRG
jgi:hypothetical protein